MKCYVCGKEMRNYVGGCYICDNCGFGIDDLIYRQPIYEPEKHCYQQGWVCPKCGAVMSPNTQECPHCMPAPKFTCGTGTAVPTEPLNNIAISHTGWTSSALYPNYDIKVYGCAGTKRGRGRPRIHPVKPKRPVGRPKKIVK